MFGSLYVLFMLCMATGLALERIIRRRRAAGATVGRTVLVVQGSALTGVCVTVPALVWAMYGMVGGPIGLLTLGVR